MKRALKTCKPLKMWIDGKCFIIKQINKRGLYQFKNDGQSLEKYEINSGSDGKLITSFRLPEIYYLKLINFHDTDIKIIENATKTIISIPSRGNLVIKGENEVEITQARDEIHSFIASIRDNLTALQFISIPIKSDEITNNFNKIKNEILSVDNIPGMDESIFISPLKLHLTIAVFALLDEHEKLEAIKALQDYKNLILDPLIQKTGSVKIQIQGINCMNQNYKKVNVLYANAKLVGENPDFSLQNFVNGISDFFYERGLVRTYQDDVKLHMTLINTKYRKESGTPRKKRWAKKQSFDATTIMDKYKDFNFGECNVDSIHLSLMSTVGDDGFYKPLSIIPVTQFKN